MFSADSQSAGEVMQSNDAGVEVTRGLSILIILALSVLGASWLFSVPVYFNVSLIVQILPLVISGLLFFISTKIHHKILYLTIIPLAFLGCFASWGYEIYLQARLISQSQSSEVSAGIMTGISYAMYIMGMVVLIIWHGRFYKYATYLSAAAVITLSILLLLFADISLSSLLAVLLLMSSAILISYLGFDHRLSINASNHAALFNDSIDSSEDVSFIRGELEEQAEVVPELDINTLPLNESSVTHDWENILRELQGELKNTPDVDQLFKRMLVFMHGAMEFEAAAVGMLQEKSLKKIASYGDDEFLHVQCLNWTGQRIKDVFTAFDAKVSQQSHISGSNDNITRPLYRLDAPVVSGEKVIGIVTLFRETMVFDTHHIKLASSIVFHSMMALKQSRLQEEVKRLSSEVIPLKLTLFTREQFLEQVKPVFEKLSRPRECSLFIVEIDNMDHIIDTVARDAGVLLYKNTSKMIMANLRENDVLGRYGKEGFIVLLDETDLNHAKQVAEIIRKKVSQLKIKYKDNVITTTISIGLTIVSDPDEDMPSLMRKADMGLFVAKENGCNTVKVSL